MGTCVKTTNTLAFGGISNIILCNQAVFGFGKGALFGFLYFQRSLIFWPCGSLEPSKKAPLLMFHKE